MDKSALESPESYDQENGAKPLLPCTVGVGKQLLWQSTQVPGNRRQGRASQVSAGNARPGVTKWAMRGRFGIASLILNRGYRDPFMFLNLLEVRRLLLDCEKVLDVGCGNNSPLQYLGLQNLVGVDGYKPAVDSALKTGCYSRVELGDIRELGTAFPREQFDACVALDVIEHLSKDDGFKLLRSMEGIARKRVILLTPNGFLPQHRIEDGDLQEHLSGWEASEVEGLGFRVLGLLGPKSMRGEFHRIKRRPRFLWASLSLIAQTLHTRRNPSSSAAILFWKDKH